MKALLLSCLLYAVQAIYFYTEKDQTRCFKDELASNFTLEMTINILDLDVVDWYRGRVAGGYLPKGTAGVKLTL